MTLSEILSYPKDSDYSSFKDQANELMLNYCIKKQVDSETIYRYYINEIELYYYNQYHKDKSVHPHFFKEAGRFRIHFSGVDITLASYWNGKEKEARALLLKGKQIRSDINPTLDFKQLEDLITKNDISYGGILLRRIQQFDDKCSNFSPIVGPLCIANELFYLEGQSLSLTLEPCSIRTNCELNIKKRIGLGKNAGDNKSDLKNYSL